MMIFWNSPEHPTLDGVAEWAQQFPDGTEIACWWAPTNSAWRASACIRVRKGNP